MTTDNSKRALRTTPLSDARNRVWLLLRASQRPMTGAEVDAALREVRGRGHFHKRLPELERAGLARRNGSRTCTVTGHQAETWSWCLDVAGEPAPKGSRLTNADLALGVRTARALLESAYHARSADPTTRAHVAIVERLLEHLEDRALEGRGL